MDSRKRQRVSRGKETTGTKLEEAPPELPIGAVVKQEEAPPEFPAGAVVKQEETPPAMPAGAVVKQEEATLLLPPLVPLTEACVDSDVAEVRAATRAARTRLLIMFRCSIAHPCSSAHECANCSGGS